MSGPVARRATRPLRIARLRIRAQRALWGLLEELDPPVVAEIEGDVVAEIEACLATLDAWAEIPPEIGHRTRARRGCRGPVRFELETKG